MRPRKRDRHLPACVYFRHGQHYYVKRGKWTPIGRDLHSALREYARIVAQPTDSMATLIDRMLPLVLANVRDSTAKHYRIAAARLRDSLIEFKPQEVTHGVVTQLLDAYQQHPAVANRLLVVLRQVFDKALERELVQSNPCHRVKRRRQPKRERLVTASEYAAIHKLASPRLQVIMDLAYLTGQRIGDVLAIRRGDLLADGIAFVQQKTGKKLVVAWTPELEDAVAQAKALSGNVHYALLICTRDGKPLAHANVWREFKRTVKRALGEGADITLHDLRAMAATKVREQGGDATALLGHTDARTTQTYLRDRSAVLVQGPRKAAK